MGDDMDAGHKLKDTQCRLNRDLELQRYRGVRTEPEANGGRWWTKRWLRYLETLATPKEITSARLRVRAGKVAALHISPGLIEAKVEGRGREPYHVRLHARLPEREHLDELERRLMERALYAASLLAGEMPAELEEVFADSEVNIVPWAGGGRRQFFCSCSSHNKDCRHIITVLYVSIGIFDKDPFLLLKMRGLEKETLLPALSAARGGLGEKGFEETAYGTEGEGSPKNRTKDAGDAADDFFYGSDALCETLPNLRNAPFDNSDLPESGSALFEFPLWRGETSFRESVDPYYASIRKLLRKR